MMLDIVAEPANSTRMVVNTSTSNITITEIELLTPITIVFTLRAADNLSLYP